MSILFLYSFLSVRGTTSKEIVSMAREAGANKICSFKILSKNRFIHYFVYLDFASAAPPVRYSNVYGIDIPTRSELIAHNRTEDEISTVIGADKVM
jgi:amidophosphoribosyltransferase